MELSPTHGTAKACENKAIRSYKIYDDLRYFFWFWGLLDRGTGLRPVVCLSSVCQQCVRLFGLSLQCSLASRKRFWAWPPPFSFRNRNRFHWFHCPLHGSIPFSSQLDCQTAQTLRTISWSKAASPVQLRCWIPCMVTFITSYKQIIIYYIVATRATQEFSGKYLIFLWTYWMLKV